MKTEFVTRISPLGSSTALFGPGAVQYVTVFSSYLDEAQTVGIELEEDRTFFCSLALLRAWAQAQHDEAQQAVLPSAEIHATLLST